MATFIEGRHYYFIGLYYSSPLVSTTVVPTGCNIYRFVSTAPNINRSLLSVSLDPLSEFDKVGYGKLLGSHGKEAMLLAIEVSKNRL